MRLFLFLVLFIGFIVMSSLYITKEDGSLDRELQEIHHTDTSALLKLHKKFEKFDINSKNLDLVEALKEINQAIKRYPLDDKLKMIKIELDNKRANETYKSSKD